ncbi:TerC family protein [Psittacicella hinzii]|uniref:TerC family protein n=1 Tax=Psittacicella hinzii TaxID=2028575 RepID=A0A3A1YDV3_9GAMM|nr:TerC family protein [Psittacicella hinzii]RIY35370.1 hypothetical protein CKF58_06710 [Psittacicella hinzii]
MFELLFDYHFYLSLFTLTLLEIVLGIDNIVVIAILVNKLPEKHKRKAQLIGLGLAMGVRVALLFTLAWLSHLIKPLFYINDFAVTGRDLVLLLGGLFLVYKAIGELYSTIMHTEHEENGEKKVYATFSSVIMQIIIMDAVFSLDSVITAIGIAEHLPVMVLAVIIAIIFMMCFSNYIVKLIDNYPSLKILALTFLVIVGLILVIEGFHIHIDKIYLYSAMGFSLLVTILNIAYEVIAKRITQKQ